MRYGTQRRYVWGTGNGRNFTLLPSSKTYSGSFRQAQTGQLRLGASANFVYPNSRVLLSSSGGPTACPTCYLIWLLDDDASFNLSKRNESERSCTKGAGQHSAMNVTCWQRLTTEMMTLERSQSSSGKVQLFECIVMMERRPTFYVYMCACLAAVMGIAMHSVSCCACLFAAARSPTSQQRKQAGL